MARASLRAGLGPFMACLAPVVTDRHETGRPEARVIGFFVAGPGLPAQRAALSLLR